MVDGWVGEEDNLVIWLVDHESELVVGILGVEEYLLANHHGEEEDEEEEVDVMSRLHH